MLELYPISAVASITVKFEFSDYSETQILERTFEVVASDLIYYDIKGLFPDYLIQNARYDFSFVTAYSLDTGVAVERETILVAYNANGQEVIVDDLFFADPAFITESGTIKFAYYPEGIEGCNVLVKEIPVIDAGVNQAGKLDISKYGLVVGKCLGAVIGTLVEKYVKRTLLTYNVVNVLILMLEAGLENSVLLSYGACNFAVGVFKEYSEILS